MIKYGVVIALAVCGSSAYAQMKPPHWWVAWPESMQAAAPEVSDTTTDDVAWQTLDNQAAWLNQLMTLAGFTPFTEWAGPKRFCFHYERGRSVCGFIIGLNAVSPHELHVFTTVSHLDRLRIESFRFTWDRHYSQGTWEAMRDYEHTIVEGVLEIW